MRYPLRRGRRRRWPSFRWPAIRPSRLVAAGVLVVVALFAGLTLRGMRADPRDAYRAGLVALDEGRFADARAQLRTGAAAEPAGAQLALARAAIEEEDGAGAEAALQRAAAAGAPAARLHSLRAAALLLQDDADGALAETDRVPRSLAAAADAAAAAEARFADRVRARALDARDDPAGAERLLSGVLATAPGETGAWVDLGRVRFGRGDLGGAEAAAARALALDRGSPAALTLEADMVASRYGPAAALPWYAAALGRDPDLVPALLPEAAALGEIGRAREALATARRVLALRPASRQPRYLMAVIAARAGNVGLARRLLQGMDDAADAVPGVLLLGGWLAQAEGHDAIAIAKWQRLLGDQPMNVALRRLLAVALTRAGDARGALETLAPLVQRGDADSESLELAARAARALGDPRAAMLHDRAIGTARGVSTAFAGDGVAALSAAAASAPDDPLAAVALVSGLIASGDTAGAVARARGLAQASPGAAPAQLALGDALIAAGRVGEAASVYARAADLRFDEPAMLRLVDALGRAGRAGEAARAVGLYLSQNPLSLIARRLAGHWRAAAGDPRAAATLEAVRRDVGNRDAALLADLAIAWTKGDVRRARVFAAAAYRLAPMNRGIVLVYATVLTRAGDAEGARQLLAKDKALAATG